MLIHNDILTEREGRQLLRAWKATHAEYPNSCAHELFEQQVARDPDAVAVVFKERQISYLGLNQCANQVARYLRKLGVRPEDLVGICLERSLEMVIALLGVWKAGGAHVPLDPAYPQDRLSFMLGDAGVKVLLTDEKCKHLFSSTCPKAVHLDADWPIIAQENTKNLGTTAMPSNLAYVMYTSGSTGQPKGAMIQHNGLVNYLCWANNTYEVDGKGSVPVHSSIAFDSTIASLYPPLLTGGQIELLPEDVGAQNLLAALRRVKNRSKVVLTPAHLELLNQQLRPEEMAGMTKVLVIAGEALSAERLSKWREFAPATRLFNEYGPTETTVGCSAYELQPGDPPNGPVPIGSPITNVQLYVLDPNLQPVPPGVLGELYIGGGGVGRGYLNKPELTRERFLGDPFSGQSGARLYKTGDLVRSRKDGTLEFLGRIDDQVKVRGYRIELGEIETALAGYPGIQSCTVQAREDSPGNKRLVAYLVVPKRESVDTEKLKQSLRQSLPEYMVPTYFVFLDSLPLNKNGKIDRNALPTPSHQHTLTTQEFVAPRTETEKKLAAIWMELLGVDRVGIHDNFFDLGGHSMLAVRAMSQIQETFGTAPSMGTFISSATIAGLAKALEDRDESGNGSVYAVAVQHKGIEPPFFWIGGGTRAKTLSDHLGPDQPFFGIGFEPQIVEKLKAPYRMEEIATNLVSVIREKQPQGPYRLGGFCLGAVVAYEVARQLTIQGQNVGLLVLFEPMNPLQRSTLRFATGLRRMTVRVGFRLRELRQLGIAELPVYARSRWKGLKGMSVDLLWNLYARSGFQNFQFLSPDLERILFFAASSYKPVPLGCPTAIFGCKDWPMLSAGDPYFGWRELLSGRSETHEVPGDHVGIFRKPNIEILADKLKTCLHGSWQAGMHT